MSRTQTPEPLPALAELPGSSYRSLSRHFAPLFERIAQGALDRELERVLPFDAVRALDQAGFAALRVPSTWGGPGVSVATQIRLLMDLAEADSNVAHIYRSHLGFLESLRFTPVQVRRVWYPRVLAGQTVGNASTEIGGNALGRLSTVLRGQPGGWRLSGTKYYATGSIFCDWTRVSAGLDGQDGRRFAVVATDAAGVRLEDDWDGFGQRLTGTGTAIFDDVAVDDDAVLERVAGSPEAVHEAAFFQLVLLAVQAGIARAADRDAVGLVTGRKRTFNTGLGLPCREDPLILEAVGRISAKAFAAQSIVEGAARVLDEALCAVCADGADCSGYTGPAPQPLIDAEIAVEQAQVTVPELVLAAAQELFLTSGASATARSRALDRHWRNAQTVATHNPISFRARALGDWSVNCRAPEGLNAIGDAPRAGAQSLAEAAR